MPIMGSSEKVIAIAACGLTKWLRICVRSVSPSTVVDIALLALGASITTRIQTSLPLAAERRFEVEITLPWSCDPLATTVLVSVAAAAELRTGLTLRGIGADAATTLERSAGAVAAGA